jgi:hypothetical protein
MHKLTRKQGSGLGGLLLFAILWNGFSLFFVVVGIASGELLASICGGLFLMIGLLIITAAVGQFMANLKIAESEIFIANPLISVGDNVRVTYQQRFKGSANVKRFYYELVFMESAKYQQGTDTVTVIHDVVLDTVDLPARQYRAGEVAHDEHMFRIPRNAMHTFAAEHNELLWQIRVRIEMTGWPDYEREYGLTVMPTLQG